MKRRLYFVLAILVGVAFVLGIQWLVSNGIIMVEEKQTQSVAEFRVAFIGDQGHGVNSFAVLELIKDEVHRWCYIREILITMMILTNGIE